MQKVARTRADAVASEIANYLSCRGDRIASDLGTLRIVREGDALAVLVNEREVFALVIVVRDGR
jgi:hypothetical protein